MIYFYCVILLAINTVGFHWLLVSWNLVAQQSNSKHGINHKQHTGNPGASTAYKKRKLTLLTNQILASCKVPPLR
jgi:hypothetical protein